MLRALYHCIAVPCCVCVVNQHSTGQGTVVPVKAVKACKADQRYSSTHSSSQRKMVNRQLLAPATLPPPQAPIA